MYRRRGTVIVALILLVVGSVNGQNLLNGVESISFDSINNRYLVSSLYDGAIVAIDTAGIQSPFRDGLTQTLGNHLVDSVLYVSTPGILVGLDAATGATVFQQSIVAWGGIDGLTADTSGFLYIVDTGGRIIKLRLSDGEHWTFASGLGQAIQDCTFDIRNNRIIVVSYIQNSQIVAVNMDDSTVVSLTTTSPGRYDGVNIDARGNVYVATHTNGSIYRYDNDFVAPPELISSGHNQPAGLCFNNRDYQLAISEFEGDTVYLVDMWKGPQIGGLAFNDSSGGDGDGILEDGETIQFAVTLDNLHEEALSDISAELSVSGPPLNVTVGSASFSDMAVGGSVDNAATPFEFDIPNGCGRQVATFSLTITWTSNYGTKVQTLSFDKSTGEASVLLVDDDLAGNDVDLYYRLALLYTDSTYDVWNASWGTPQAAHLGEYDMVIWFTGDHRSNLLTPDEIITIKAYLDAGGNLLLSGQGIAGQLDTTDADFLHNYLRCEYVKTSYYPYLAAQPGAQVFDASVALKIDGSGGADNQSVLDHIDPINGGVAELQYWGKPNSGAVSYSGDYRLLFLSFGFEAIINGDAQWTERDVVFPQMMAYFEWINPLFCCEVRADLDFDGLGPDIADLVFLVDYMFSGGGVPPCWQASDIDANGAGPDIADLVYLVDYMFAGGPPPPICL